MSVPLLAAAAAHPDRTALEAAGRFASYRELLDASERIAGALLAGESDLGGRPIGFLVEPSFEWVAVLWGIWRAGGVAVPMCLSHPRPELEYVAADADVDTLVAGGELAERLGPVAEARGARLLSPGALLAADRPPSLPEIARERGALIVYTSGTTGGPKGVLTTHANLAAQVGSLRSAWEWRADDRILLVLPLHHVHGIVNVVLSALASGAGCRMLPAFDAEATWEILAGGRLSLFMAVPTIYSRLAAAWDAMPEPERLAASRGCRRLRLMVSGSAALPVRLLERWREIGGHTLLERYGMTEIGMALGNPLHGERRPGHVGVPFPGVEVRRVDEDGNGVADDVPGEIEVRGPTVFREYWGRPGETADAFRDGWFRTGDVAVVDRGSYRILGRQSVDIVKTGGYKVSALEVEEVLREHPGIAECAVVGVADEEWGEVLSAAVMASAGGAPGLEELRAWAKERLAPYKVPRRMVVVDELPRNPLGKVVKPRVKELFTVG